MAVDELCPPRAGRSDRRVEATEKVGILALEALLPNLLALTKGAIQRSTTSKTERISELIDFFLLSQENLLNTGNFFLEQLPDGSEAMTSLCKADKVLRLEAGGGQDTLHNLRRQQFNISHCNLQSQPKTRLFLL